MLKSLILLGKGERSGKRRASQKKRKRVPRCRWLSTNIIGGGQGTQGLLESGRLRWTMQVDVKKQGAPARTDTDTHTHKHTHPLTLHTTPWYKLGHHAEQVQIGEGHTTGREPLGGW